MEKMSQPMRDYRFRGKRVETGEWVYGIPVLNLDKSVCMIKGATEIDFIYNKVDPETVGQYTGTKDIYEGDIVEVGISKYVVIWGHKSCGYKLKLIAKGVYRYLPMSKAERVVGNIYDDPELLEVQG